MDERNESMRSGEKIIFSSDDGGEEVTLTITKLERFTSFEEFLTKHLAQALPGIPIIEAGIAVYRQFYTKLQEIEAGSVLAIFVKPSI